jgi:serine/threonine protein kinase
VTQVYKGRHKSQAELVAIKAIPLQKFIVNPPLRKMIDAEEKALRLATHEHIIKLFQVFQTDKEIDLIYEFCDGGSLGDLMKRHLFSEPEALKILHDVAQALQALKVHNIVHRDIKPENIFVKQGCVKLGDFGLCMIGEPTNQDSFTHIGSFIFMAPESLTQFLYTFKSDVYSLGIMM